MRERKEALETELLSVDKWIRENEESTKELRERQLEIKQEIEDIEAELLLVQVLEANTVE